MADYSVTTTTAVRVWLKEYGFSDAELFLSQPPGKPFARRIDAHYRGKYAGGVEFCGPITTRSDIWQMILGVLKEARRAAWPSVAAFTVDPTREVSELGGES